MQAGRIAAIGGAVLLGVVIGAGGMYVYVRRQAASALQQFSVALQANAAAPASADVSKTDWTVQSNTNQITGASSWYMAAISREVSATLYVECETDGAFKVWVHGDRLYPGEDARDLHTDDNYRVSYRFDAKPGVTDELWKGVEHAAYAANSDMFLTALEGNQRLVMQFASSGMSGADDAAYDHFDLDGFNAALAKLVPHCVNPRAK